MSTGSMGTLVCCLLAVLLRLAAASASVLASGDMVVPGVSQIELAAPGVSQIELAAPGVGPEDLAVPVANTAVLAALVVNPADLAAPVASPTHLASPRAGPRCVSDPDAYWQLFSQAAPPPECVSPQLMVTIQGPCSCQLNKDACSDTAHWAPNATFAWISGEQSLELYLNLSHRHGADGRWETTKAMLASVGFPVSYIFDECHYLLALISRQKADEHGMFVPTFASWFEHMRKRWGMEFQAEAVRETVLNGFEFFSELTGCPGRNADPLRPKRCNRQFEAVRRILSPLIEDTPECIKAFAEKYDSGRPARAVHLRALLLFCFDVNPFNTGIGYGWDGQDFTLAEFIVENGLLVDDLGAKVFDLYQPGMA